MSAVDSPHVVLTTNDNTHIFQNDEWNETLNNIVIFDEVFVDENVCSGLQVEAGHRQGLHGLIIGSRGVALNQSLSELVAKIESHNAKIREIAGAISPIQCGSLPIDEFCALEARPDIETEIEEYERRRNAAAERADVSKQPLFDMVRLPSISQDGILLLLARTVSEIDDAAAEQVANHVVRLQSGGEQWLEQGLQHAEHLDGACPFCLGDRKSLLKLYREYFSEEYTRLSTDLVEALSAFDKAHNGDAMRSFERAISLLQERIDYWSRFVQISMDAPETEEIVGLWTRARELVKEALQNKLRAPLLVSNFNSQTQAALAKFSDALCTIKSLNQQLESANTAVRAVKARAVGEEVAVLDKKLEQLRATRARHSQPLVEYCDQYLSEKCEKKNTELLREAAKTQLEEYRTIVFPEYESVLNQYLEYFNVNFRLESVMGINNRSGATCSYSVRVDNGLITAAAGSTGEPSLRTALSAGDRTTLALAFFFASIERDLDSNKKIVVLDDPMTSLDEHRTMATTNKICQLASEVAQVVVLSHDRSFLCRIWAQAQATMRSALILKRSGTGTEIGLWDPSEHGLTEYDRLHKVLRLHVANGSSNVLDTARAIRPILEGYLRVACPEHFGPGKLLGPFAEEAKQRIGTPEEVLSESQVERLKELTAYANRFHHNSNPSWHSEFVNEDELTGNVRRTLTFVNPTGL